MQTGQLGEIENYQITSVVFYATIENPGACKENLNSPQCQCSPEPFIMTLYLQSADNKTCSLTFKSDN